MIIIDFSLKLNGFNARQFMRGVLSSTDFRIRANCQMASKKQFDTNHYIQKVSIKIYMNLYGMLLYVSSVCRKI